jgi:hypothetical protein
MLTLEDCIALSELTEEEIEAIAEHEHLPEIVAAELGCVLVRTAAGRRRIAAMIGDDIAVAQSHGNRLHAVKLKLALKHFVATHGLRRNQSDARNLTRPR